MPKNIWIQSWLRPLHDIFAVKTLPTAELCNKSKTVSA
jgi:hypothetical protein